MSEQGEYQWENKFGQYRVLALEGRGAFMGTVYQLKKKTPRDKGWKILDAMALSEIDAESLLAELWRLAPYDGA